MLGVKYQKVKGSCAWIVVEFTMYTEYSRDELWTRFVNGDVDGTVNHMSVITL